MALIALEELRSIETLIYVVAVLGALVLPVFKSIREARARARDKGAEPERAVAAGENPAEAAPRIEHRPADEVPEATIGVPTQAPPPPPPPKLQPEPAAQAPRPAAVPQRAAEVAAEGFDIQLDDGYSGLGELHSSLEKEAPGTDDAPREPEVAQAASEDVLAAFGEPNALRRVIVLKEILDAPLGLRPGQRFVFDE